ncbi:hypothetical protein LRP52_40455 [Photobacterium sp. ZSDE20]|uniref:Uncharacterized protein n=1 Tax=Photobacterium pectinilyticum TaxID=2906793 RepID=A0ABT1N7Q8_9GAMM|nr:hypothetical protein [Photobacterium sp. ZSDE20]MCQ1060766.1 hypothetical protein [Photobacterium sp. ZSDE20]MDD1828455.1 hypothetical protein [Photobacterium sp. ZSDE20]
MKPLYSPRPETAAPYQLHLGRLNFDCTITDSYADCYSIRGAIARYRAHLNTFEYNRDSVGGCVYQAGEVIAVISGNGRVWQPMETGNDCFAKLPSREELVIDEPEYTELYCRTARGCFFAIDASMIDRDQLTLLGCSSFANAEDFFHAMSNWHDIHTVIGDEIVIFERNGQVVYSCDDAEGGLALWTADRDEDVTLEQWIASLDDDGEKVSGVDASKPPAILRLGHLVALIADHFPIVSVNNIDEGEQVDGSIVLTSDVHIAVRFDSLEIGQWVDNGTAMKFHGETSRTEQGVKKDILPKLVELLGNI